MTKLQDSVLVKKASQEEPAMNASLGTEKPRPKLPPALVCSALCYLWAGCTRLCRLYSALVVRKVDSAIHRIVIF